MTFPSSMVSTLARILLHGCLHLDTLIKPTILFVLQNLPSIATSILVTLSTVLPTSQRNQIMAKTINLLWALPVDTATLSARLEAFLERRAICSTLSICAKKPVSPIPAHLPPTVIEKITSAVTEAAYQSKIRGWMTAVDCIRGDCWHKPKAYYEGSHGINSKDFDGEHSYGCDLNAYGYTVQEVHHRNVGAYLEKIQRFKKRKEV